MTILPTNYQDDVLSAEMNGKRRYRLTIQDDGTYILDDVTTYDLKGSSFGALAVNQICEAVNGNTTALNGLEFKVVDQLPPDAAEHPNTIYIVIEGK